ncbi:hypothetical protein [Kosakonia sacchari]|uniref:hypothetical protein n=1 Tax=Kosakonia sacchari TaxID=1158459 RepID=UPI001584CBCE|nr:hypothetical protein [Kosakonia sacchari]
MPHNRRWSEEEDRFLRTHAHCMSVKQFSVIFGRTERAIQGYATTHKIRLRKYGNYHHHTKHADDDVLLIRALAESGMSFSDIGAKFDISGKSAYQLAYYRLTAEEGETLRMLP